MVKIGLQLKAELENITNLKAEDEDFRWYLKLKCLSCGEETKEFIYLTLSETAPLKGGRGTASLVLKCRLCSRENSIDIIAPTIKPYDAEDSGKFKTIVEFDCRGVEPTDFSPRTGFSAASSENEKVLFNDISLLEKDWSDYDEQSQVTVGIYELEHKFIKIK